MKENLKLTNIGNVAKRIAATIIIGGTLAKFAPDAVQAITNYDTAQKVARCAQIDSYLTTPPEDSELNIRTRKIALINKTVELNQTEMWNPDSGRWLNIGRQLSVIPQTNQWQLINDLNTFDAENSIDTLEMMFSSGPKSDNDIIRRGFYGTSDQYVYVYCWDKQNNSWQQIGKEDTPKPMPMH